jgi:hypothetical protein
MTYPWFELCDVGNTENRGHSENTWFQEHRELSDEAGLDAGFDVIRQRRQSWSSTPMRRFAFASVTAGVLLAIAGTAQADMLGGGAGCRHDDR